jgi:integrase
LDVVAWLNTLSYQTQRVYRRAWEDVVAYSPVEPSRLEAAVIQAWLAERSRRYSPATLSVWFHAVRAFYESAQGQALANPTATLAAPRVSARRTRGCLTASQARVLLRACDTGDLAGLRNWTIVALLLVTGQRLEAILNMREPDLRFGLSTVRWLVSADQELLLPPAISRTLRRLIQAADDEAPASYVFRPTGDQAANLLGPRFNPAGYAPLSVRALQTALARAARRAGLQPQAVTPSSLRRTAAHLRAQAGESPAAIANLLGLTLPRTRALLREADAHQEDDAWLRVADLLGLEAGAPA